MTFVKHQLVGPRDNVFSAPLNLYIGFNGDRGLYAYKLPWNNKFIISNSLTPVTYQYSVNGSTNYFSFGNTYYENRPVFSSSYGYLYQYDSYVFISNSVGFYLQPHRYYQQNVEYVEWDSGFKSGQYSYIGDNNITLSGYGNYDGQTLSLSAVYVPGARIYESDSSSQFTTYTKIQGSGNATMALGSRYWTDSNGNRYVQSPYNQRSTWPTVTPFTISGVQRVYLQNDDEYVWRIYKNVAKTQWWQNDEYCPVNAQNYTYTYGSSDGTTGSDKVLTFAGYTDNTPFKQQLTFADFSRFM